MGRQEIWDRRKDGAQEANGGRGGGRAGGPRGECVDLITLRELSWSVI